MPWTREKPSPYHNEVTGLAWRTNLGDIRIYWKGSTLHLFLPQVNFVGWSRERKRDGKSEIKRKLIKSQIGDKRVRVYESIHTVSFLLQVWSSGMCECVGKGFEKKLRKMSSSSTIGAASRNGEGLRHLVIEISNHLKGGSVQINHVTVVRFSQTDVKSNDLLLVLPIIFHIIVTAVDYHHYI